MGFSYFRFLLAVLWQKVFTKNLYKLSLIKVLAECRILITDKNIADA